MSESEKKIFDDYPVADCNICENYWLSACDGAHTGTTRLCTTFKAVRLVNIPLQIKSLQRAYKWLVGGYVALAVLFIAHIVFHVLG